MPPKRKVSASKSVATDGTDSATSMANSLSRAAEAKYLTNKQYCGIIGVDEAGRGPLCGPVVCAVSLYEIDFAIDKRLSYGQMTKAAYIPDNIVLEGIMIKDSKATKEQEREEAYEQLVNHPNVVWGVSVVSNEEIDQINILEASMVGMKRATDQVLDKLFNTSMNTNSKSMKLTKTIASLSHLVALVDGNHVPREMRIDTIPVIKGDGHIYSIAAASIIAKVTRDRIMIELDKKFPQYNIKQHKGYPTFEHRSVLHRLGPAPIYRFCYKPVRDAALAHNYPLPDYVSSKDAGDGKGKSNISKSTIRKAKSGERAKPVASIPAADSVNALISDQQQQPTEALLEEVHSEKRITRKQLRELIHPTNVPTAAFAASDEKKSKRSKRN